MHYVLRSSLGRVCDENPCRAFATVWFGFVKLNKLIIKSEEKTCQIAVVVVVVVVVVVKTYVLEKCPQSSVFKILPEGHLISNRYRTSFNRKQPF
jgi:hypothetical protein